MKFSKILKNIWLVSNHSLAVNADFFCSIEILLPTVKIFFTFGKIVIQAW